MAHFGAYSTSDPNAAANSWTALGANGVLTLGPMQTETAQTIAGSVFSDQSGTMLVQQTFDGSNWDISQSFTVVGGTAQSFNVSVIAPVSQIVYTNGATPQGTFRLFARTFTLGR
jgi:hypothetical protein